jgi:hypothetical protein
METLPWELIGEIGRNLAPKWRCRLYLCRKLWYVECYSADMWLFKWHATNYNVLSDIKSIKEDIIRIDNSEAISRRTIGQHCVFTYTWTKENDTEVYLVYRYMEISSRTGTYEWYNLDLESGEARFIYDNDRNYDAISSRYNRYDMLQNNPYMYNIYCSINYIHEYLNYSDLYRLLIACGKNIYYNIWYDEFRDDSLAFRLSATDAPKWAKIPA